jgi:hypothetical protein
MSFPTNPANNSTTIVNGITYVYNASYGTWTRVPWSSYTASSLPPTNSKAGDQWYNTSTDILYEYVYDGGTYMWVDTISSSYATPSTAAADILNPFLLAGL